MPKLCDLLDSLGSDSSWLRENYYSPSLDVSREAWRLASEVVRTTELAERLLVSSLITPPHWLRVVNCPKCGPMSSRDDVCRWCKVFGESELGQFFSEVAPGVLT